MPFSDSIRDLPYRATTPNGRGFVPPLVRAMGHILYLLGNLADEDVTVTEEQGLTELRHAEEHWNARATTENVSSAARERADTISLALRQAITEFPDWTEDQRVQNLRDFSHRVLQYSADLDRELVGLADSDAGTAL